MKGYHKAAAHKGKVAYRTPSRMRPVRMKPMQKNSIDPRDFHFNTTVIKRK